MTPGDVRWFFFEELFDGPSPPSKLWAEGKQSTYSELRGLGVRLLLCVAEENGLSWWMKLTGQERDRDLRIQLDEDGWLTKLNEVVSYANNGCIFLLDSSHFEHVCYEPWLYDVAHFPDALRASAERLVAESKSYLTSRSLDLPAEGYGLVYQDRDSAYLVAATAFASTRIRRSELGEAEPGARCRISMTELRDRGLETLAVDFQSKGVEVAQPTGWTLPQLAALLEVQEGDGRLPSPQEDGTVSNNDVLACLTARRTPPSKLGSVRWPGDPDSKDVPAPPGWPV